MDHRLPALGRDGGERRDVLAAGVVDEAVDAAVRCDDGGDGRAYRFFLADVEGLRAGLAAAGFDLGAYLVELLGLAADQHHLRAERREFVRLQRPMPEPPPVTTMTCPPNRPGAKTER